ncbi:MAG TPA: hypothetical protein VF595_06730 [Tepidisphaeraceae bacterium]|jgi:hypothetical protein
MPNVGQPADRDVPGPPKNQTGSNDSTSEPPLVDESEIEGSMHTEEPTGWDQAPQAIDNPRQKRHPRPDGVGGIKPADGPDRASDHM